MSSIVGPPEVSTYRSLGRRPQASAIIPFMLDSGGIPRTRLRWDGLASNNRFIFVTPDVSCRNVAVRRQLRSPGKRTNDQRPLRLCRRPRSRHWPPHLTAASQAIAARRRRAWVRPPRQGQSAQPQAPRCRRDAPAEVLIECRGAAEDDRMSVTLWTAQSTDVLVEGRGFLEHGRSSGSCDHAAEERPTADVPG